MGSSARSMAEERFAATQKRAERALSDRDEARREVEDRTATLRALRLAKQASDLEATETAAAVKKTPLRMPRGH